MQTSNILRVFTVRNAAFSKRQLQTSASVSVGKWWRLKNHMFPHGNPEEGRIVDDLDWSYVDGRKAELNRGRKSDQLLQIEICKKIIATSKEVDFMVEDHAKSLKDAAEVKQSKLDSKLKAKGDLLLANASK